MEEQTNKSLEEKLKQLPYQHLLDKHKIAKDNLKPHTKQLITDLNKTITLIINASKRTGEIRITEKNKQKIDTYDRYICDGIFEYLDEEEEKLNSADTPPISNEPEIKEPTITEPEIKEEKEESPPRKKIKMGLGFWDWK